MQPWKKLSNTRLIYWRKASNSRIYMDRYFERHSVQITPDFELGNMDLLVSFAKNDLGIACVIRNFAEEELTSGKLYEIKPVERIPARNIGVAWLKDVPLSAASKELMSMLDDNETYEI